MKTTFYTLLCGLLLLSGCNSTDSEIADAINQAIKDNNLTQDQNGTDDQEEIPEKTPPVEVKKVGWYLRTTVTATLPDGRVLTHNTAGVFGELDESDAGKDKHDIPSYGASALQIRFINENISPDKEYFSDYRKYEDTEKKETWTFAVKNEYTREVPAVNLANADFTIAVEPMVEVLKKEGYAHYIEKKALPQTDKRNALTLIDLDNGKVYGYEELSNVTFNFDGSHVRTFKWVLGEVDNNDMAQSKGVEEIKAKTSSTFSFQKQKSSGNDTFGLPPL